MGLISIGVRAPSLPRFMRFPTSLFPLFLSSRYSRWHHPPPLVRVPPVLSANRPGCHSARDAMPEVAAGSSRKSFLERARSKLLRWLRRSLRTTHQVNKFRGHFVPFTRYCPVILIAACAIDNFPGRQDLCAPLVPLIFEISVYDSGYLMKHKKSVLCHANCKKSVEVVAIRRLKMKSFKSVRSKFSLLGSLEIRGINGEKYLKLVAKIAGFKISLEW